MSPYGIFAIALTIAYIIYYGYIISKDLYGKKGSEEASDEIFEVEAQETATQVRETEHGFAIGAEEENRVEPVADARQAEQEADAKKEAMAQKLNGLEEQMEEADIECTGGLDEIEFSELLREAYSNKGMIRNGVKLVMDHV